MFEKFDESTKPNNTYVIPFPPKNIIIRGKDCENLFVVKSSSNATFKIIYRQGFYSVEKVPNSTEQHDEFIYIKVKLTKEEADKFNHYYVAYSQVQIDNADGTIFTKPEEVNVLDSLPATIEDLDNLIKEPYPKSVE